MKIKVWIYQLMPDGTVYSLRKRVPVSLQDNYFTITFRKTKMKFLVPQWFIEYVLTHGQDKYLTYNIENPLPIQTREALLSPIETRGWARLLQIIQRRIWGNKYFDINNEGDNSLC